MRILLIDDDPLLGPVLEEDFKSCGYILESITDSRKGLLQAQKGIYDIILLDIRMPGISGLEFIKQLRTNHGETPVIMLTSDSGQASKLESFQEGADDYILKPFYFPEVLARVRAVMKRALSPNNEASGLTLGQGFFDYKKYRLQIGDRSLSCHKHEIQILKLLSSRPGGVLSREEIIHGVWGPTYIPTSRTVDNFIQKLRQKIRECGFPKPEKVLSSVYSIGYRLVLEEE